LLAALERGDFLAGRVLKIHCKRERPDHQARRNILTDLEALLGSKLPDFLVVGFDLSRNGRANRMSILRLNDRDRLRRLTRATVYRKRGSSLNPLYTLDFSEWLYAVGQSLRERWALGDLLRPRGDETGATT
jgi:hypothetical protein